MRDGEEMTYIKRRGGEEEKENEWELLVIRTAFDIQVSCDSGVEVGDLWIIRPVKMVVHGLK